MVYVAEGGETGRVATDHARNLVTAFARALAVALLLGLILLGLGAAVHPVLAGSPESQLRTIADTTHWRTMHL